MVKQVFFSIFSGNNCLAYFAEECGLLGVVEVAPFYVLNIIGGWHMQLSLSGMSGFVVVHARGRKHRVSLSI